MLGVALDRRADDGLDLFVDGAGQEGSHLGQEVGIGQKVRALAVGSLNTVLDQVDETAKVLLSVLKNDGGRAPSQKLGVSGRRRERSLASLDSCQLRAQLLCEGTTQIGTKRLHRDVDVSLQIERLRHGCVRLLGEGLLLEKGLLLLLSKSNRVDLLASDDRGLLLLLLLLQLLLLLLLSCVCHCRDAALFARKVIALLLRCRILGQSARICSFGCFFCCILQTIIANLQPDVCACTATTDARTCECDALTTIIVRLDFASVPPAARLSITSVSAYAEESCEHTTQSHACREMRACTQRTRALRGRTGQRWGSKPHESFFTVVGGAALKRHSAAHEAALQGWRKAPQGNAA